MSRQPDRAASSCCVLGKAQGVGTDARRPAAAEHCATQFFPCLLFHPDCHTHLVSGTHRLSTSRTLLQFQLTVNLVAVAVAVTGAVVATESPLTAVQVSPAAALLPGLAPCCAVPGPEIQHPLQPFPLLFLGVALPSSFIVAVLSPPVLLLFSLVSSLCADAVGEHDHGLARQPGSGHRAT